MAEDDGMVQVACDWCKGTGKIQCPRCGGSKKDPEPPFGACCNCDDKAQTTCTYCYGRGYNVYPREK